MNKKKFNISNLFNGKLFFEAFKQIRIVGFVGLVLLSAIGIFMPLFERAEDGFDNYHNYGEALLDVEGYMFPLIALIFIITPIFMPMRNTQDSELFWSICSYSHFFWKYFY